jgi:hypothetical protein
LEWATASETNNDYFQIERATNPVNWEAAGRIAGQGKSTSYQFYEFEDETAVEYANKASSADHTVYYRLKQVDFNGKFTYSNIKSVRFETAEFFDFSIYPNPARNNNAKINFISPADSSIELKVTDTNGKTIFSTRISHKNFDNFNLINLKSGVYFIEAKDDISLIRKRFLVE